MLGVVACGIDSSSPIMGWRATVIIIGCIATRFLAAKMLDSAKSLGFKAQPLKIASSPLQYRFKEFSNLNRSGFNSSRSREYMGAAVIPPRDFLKSSYAVGQPLNADVIPFGEVTPAEVALLIPLIATTIPRSGIAIPANDSARRPKFHDNAGTKAQAAQGRSRPMSAKSLKSKDYLPLV